MHFQHKFVSLIVSSANDYVHHISIFYLHRQLINNPTEKSHQMHCFQCHSSISKQIVFQCSFTPPPLTPPQTPHPLFPLQPPKNTASTLLCLIVFFLCNSEDYTSINILITISHTHTNKKS